MGSTHHADVRAQQRGIPPLILQWLDEFGEEVYVGNGAVKCYFSARSIRRMEQAFGRKPVQLMRRYLNSYKVESSSSGVTITTGRRTSRVRRK